VTSTDLTYNHTNSHPHATNARLAAHHLGLLGDAIQLSHVSLLIETR
jgi:hypothetical protein